MSRFAAKNLAAIRAAIDHHNASCPVPASAILLNPVDHELLGFDELWGLPVLPDERVPTKRVRIRCDGSAFGVEDAVEEFAVRPRPVEVPVVAPAGPAEEENARPTVPGPRRTDRGRPGARATWGPTRMARAGRRP